MMLVTANLVAVAAARSQSVPEAAPAPLGPRHYYPTYSPMPGAPRPEATPNGNLPRPRPPMQVSPDGANWVMPAGGSHPAPLAHSILAAPQVLPAAGSAAGPPHVQAPCVLIEKRGPDTTMFGQPIEYEIIVRNPGPCTAYQVRVEEELPAPVRFVSSEPPADAPGARPTWTLGTLEPNVERRIRIQVQPPGEGELRTCATVTLSGMATLRTQVVQPRLAVTVRAPDKVAAGESAPFQFQIANAGSVAISGLVARSRLSEGLQHPQGQNIEAELSPLAPGESRSITLMTTAVRGGQQTCDLTVTAQGVEASGRAVVAVLEPNLQLRRDGPTRCYLRGEVTFELEITNPGSAPAGNVVVTDSLPPGLEFILASEGGTFDAASRTITWRAASLPPGGKRTLTYRVRAQALGEHVDRAAARADAGAIVRAEGAFLVEGVAAMSVEVIDLNDPVEVGGELTYEVRIINQGSCPCTNIQISASAPDGMQPREGAGPTLGRVAGSTISFDPLPRLATKADAVYRIKVRGLAPGDYRFRVQMTCDQLKQPVVKEESSRVY